jgi:hypothetical protein
MSSDCNTDELYLMAVASLCKALVNDCNAIVRRSSAEALGIIGHQKAVVDLSQALHNDPDSMVRYEAAKALGKIGGNKMGENRIINTGGGNYYESINTGGGSNSQASNFYMSQDLSEAAAKIQDLLSQLQNQGISESEAQAEVAINLANQANANPDMKTKLLKWGQSVGNATISDVAKEVIKIAIRTAGLPIP